MAKNLLTQQKIIIFDDDPTGIQTVHGCLVLTCWDLETIREAFDDDIPFFFILTNTRALSRSDASAVINDAVEAVLEVAREKRLIPILVSRSDSTLRSHFPLEIEAIGRRLEMTTGAPVDAVFVAPAFFEGGRVTVENEHYLIEAAVRTPAAATEFARDSVFGYSTSNLPAYIEEKSGGRIQQTDVRSVSLSMLRNHNGELETFLESLTDSAFVVVNGESYSDFDVFTTAIQNAIAGGKRFTFHCAASLAKSLAGVETKPYLTLSDLRSVSICKGLVVVGSHVKKTSAQLNKLLTNKNVQGIEVDVHAILGKAATLQRELLSDIDAAWRAGTIPVVFASRKEIVSRNSDERLAVGSQISDFLVTLVQAMPSDLSFLIAKGGITSHDILARGLKVSSSRVAGQVLPGVPVVVVPAESRWAGMAYVIFPGNVGGENALDEVVNLLQPRRY